MDGKLDTDEDRKPAKSIFTTEKTRVRQRSPFPLRGWGCGRVLG